MGANCVVLAFTAGNVIVAKQVLLNAEDAKVQSVINALKAKNPSCTVTFLNENEINEIAKRFHDERNPGRIGL